MHSGDTVGHGAAWFAASDSTLAMLALALTLTRARDVLGERLNTSSNCSAGGLAGVTGEGTAEDHAVPESGDRPAAAGLEERCRRAPGPVASKSSVMEVLFSMCVSVAANSAEFGSLPGIGAAGKDAARDCADATDGWRRGTSTSASFREEDEEQVESGGGLEGFWKCSEPLADQM